MQPTNFKNGEGQLSQKGLAWISGLGVKFKSECVPLLKLTFYRLRNASHCIVSMGQKQAQTVKSGLIKRLRTVVP